jgi:hypothetical protein
MLVVLNDACTMLRIGLGKDCILDLLEFRQEMSDVRQNGFEIDVSHSWSGGTRFPPELFNNPSR